MDRFLLGIFLSAVSAPLALLFPGTLKGRFVFIMTLAGSCLVISGVVPVLIGIDNPVSFMPFETAAVSTAVPAHGWNPVLEIDAISALFAALTAAIVPLMLLFADGYIRRAPPGRGVDSHYFFLPLFTTAMIFLYAAGDSLTFLFLWEIMTGASLLLLLYDHSGEEPVSAGIYYLAASGFGFGLLLTGFTVASVSAGGDLSFQAMASGLAGKKDLSTIVFGLLAAGFAVKLGLVPLHTWLPRAHPAAPSHVSALMSALMVKAGLYGIIRTAGIAGSCGPWPFAILAAAGGLTAILAILQAIGARDYKRMLAMSTVENTGIMALAVGTGLFASVTGHPEAAFMAMAGGLMHAVSHGLSKGLAFLGAGAIYGSCHTRDVERLGGLGKAMPLSAGTTMIGAASLCGLPPFAGFPGELLIILANFRLMREWGHHSPGPVLAVMISSVGLAFAGACALSVFSKFFSVAFLGHPRSPEAASARESGVACGIPMVLLAVAIVFLGVFPGYFLDIVSRPAALALLSVSANHFGFEGIPEAATKAMAGTNTGAVILIGFAALFLGVRKLVLSGRIVSSVRTWDCGYRGGTPSMQYTSSSFSQPFATLAAPLMGRTVSLHRPEGLFPKGCSIETRYHDPVETLAVEPVIRGFRALLDRFSWIQGGDARSYIFYGLAFLVAALIILLRI